MISIEDKDMETAYPLSFLFSSNIKILLFCFCNSYQDAAEKDVKRYERSFKKLSPAHKELLFHLGLKYQRLRWCISMNTSFIMNMLEAFEPPFDMSQCVDGDCHDCAEHMHGHSHADTINNSELLAQHCCPEEGANTRETENKKDEEVHMVGSSQPAACNLGISQGEDKSCNDGKDASAAANCQDTDCFASSTDENITPGHRRAPSLPLDVPPVDVDKVRCIIRNIVRDWAQEGQIERDECYKPILEELNRLFPDRSRPPSCLVPGAGLGRLALEISSLGFVSQGNEFSYYMMICSSFILNHTQEANEWTIYPWIHNNCNSLSDKDQLRAVSFPDIHPSSAGITEGFSMCAGDFVEVYNEESQESAWDAVVTCFFLDTAHNIVEYIEIISKILKDGGVWVNMGPLLYHFADAYGPDDDMSIELSLEDVKRVAYHYGFVMEVEKMIDTTYTANMVSMMQNRYRAAFWTMRKDASRSKAKKRQ
ncbi:unnamed protein product [Triticum turgidum subsp. durum]|uniref:carnosine N-methyltransferase n=1 Tax=Triticum turgidum subsp. durum TaxID=4567 RepID=A0A9R0QFK1_TRITD|nr:unnamed protein product [Triticum turgidum subsp. durum]